MRGTGLIVAVLLLVPLLAGCIAEDPPTTSVTQPEPSPTFRLGWTPEDPRVGETISFEVVTDDPSDPVTDAAWNFGDGTGMNSITPDKSYRAAGWYPVSVALVTLDGHQTTLGLNLLVREPDGSMPDGARKTTTSTPDSAPPTTAGSPLPSPEVRVDLDENRLTASFTWDRNPSSIRWDLGDGTTSDDDRVQHAYLSKGTYEVTLQLWDGDASASASTAVEVTQVPFTPRIVVGVTDSGINPYHDIYHRPGATDHPCTYVEGYSDCSVSALELTVGPGGGSYSERLSADAAVWSTVEAGQWYWIPETNLIGVRCPAGGSSQGGRCILDDESTHGTGTTSSVLTEVPDALIVFNDGSSSPQLATSPVPIDIESNSWGSLAPHYGGVVNGPTGQQICHDDIDAPTSIKFRSAGNNGPVPNMGDCWRNGYRTYSVSGGYPDGSHSEKSGSAPDFASYWCRPVASAGTLSEWRNACGTSFAAPTAAGTAAGALLEIRRELGYTGGSSTTEVAPGISHEFFIDAVIQAATYDPQSRSGYPSSGLTGLATGQTPWYWWGWGWLHAEQIPAIVDCAMDRPCPDNKSEEAWAFNDLRRSFASDGDP